MAGEIRQNRVSSAIKRFISTFLLSEYGNSPVSMITIHKVTVLPDLRMAKIYYSTFGNEDLKLIQDFLEKNTKNIRYKLASHLKNLKFAPEIKFVHDNSVEQMIRIEKIFDSIKSQKESGDER